MEWCPRMPIVRKCCFCVPIRKGVIILGYFFLVLSLLAIPVFLFLLVEVTKYGESEELQPSRLDQIVHVSTSLAFLFIDVVLHIMLLVGAHKRNRCLLKGFMYSALMFHLVVLSVDFVVLTYDDALENAVYLFLLGLSVYLLFLVYNTVRVIDESSVQYVANQDQSQLEMGGSE